MTSRLLPLSLLLLASCQFSVRGLPVGSSSSKPASGKYTMPDLFAMSEAEAIAALRRAGHTGEVRHFDGGCGSVVNKRIIERGAVCYQSPAAGQTASTRLSVHLRVQHEDPRHGRVGERMEWHLMPDVIGLPVAEARRKVIEAGFRADGVEVSPRDIAGCAPGIVCRTYPSPLVRGSQSNPTHLLVGADPVF